MRYPIPLLLSSALSVLAPATASAQDSGRIGVTMGYPTAVGVIWHVADSIAVRPEATFSGISADGTVASSSTSFGVGVSGLFYIKRWDALRAYISPRYAYSHTSSSSTLTIDPPISLPIDLSLDISNSTSQHAIAGSFGAQYLAHQHFGVFGEIGAGVAFLKSSASTTVPLVPSLERPTATSWGVRSSVGVIFYF
jgi:hypothetical protein